MTSDYADLTRSFEAQDLDASRFRHMDHVGVAYEMLKRHDFISLIAERMATTEHRNYDEFIARNGDLKSKDVLRRWYSPDRLNSDAARRVFLLPDAV